jgi:hypothetical protein
MLRRSKLMGMWLAGFAGCFLMVTVTATSLLASEAQTPLQTLEKAAQGMEPSIKTISGSVVELSKDLKGTVTSMGINTEKEGTFVVESDPKSQELENLIGKKIEVTGAVHETEGKNIITIRDYKVLD